MKRMPHKSNKRTIVRNSALALALLLLFAGAAASFQSTASIYRDSVAAVLASVLVDLTNQGRAEQGASALRVEPMLVAAAQRKADHMAQGEYFAHTSPDGKTPWYWLTEAGYRFSYAGENLAVNFSESENVVRAWMNSPSHRANILNPNFTEIGIATSSGMYKGKPAVYVVQMFGKPSLLSIRSSKVRTIESTELRSSTRQLAGVGNAVSTEELSIVGATDMRVIYGLLAAVLLLVIGCGVFIVRRRTQK